MNKPYTIIVKNLDGWWSAVCKELCVSGFGPSEEEAINSVVRSIRSTLTAQAALLKRNLSGIRQIAEVHSEKEKLSRQPRSAPQEARARRAPAHA